MRTRFLLCLCLISACLLPAVAQPRTRELKISADRLDYDDARNRVRLVGNVRLESSKATFTAPYAEYHTDSQTAELSGGIKLVTPDSTAVASRMTVYYPERRGVLAGGVRLVTQSPDPKTRTPVTLTAEKLEYQWEAGLGVASGGIAARQGDRRAYADRAYYKRDQAVIDMEGNVRFEQGKEDWLTADRARMDLDAETVTASGGVFARMLVEEVAAPKQPITPPTPPVLEPDLPLEPVEAAPPATLPGLER